MEKGWHEDIENMAAYAAEDGLSDEGIIELSKAISLKQIAEELFQFRTALVRTGEAIENLSSAGMLDEASYALSRALRPDHAE